MKVGDQRFCCYCDGEDKKLEFWLYQCRTIRGGFSYWVKKDSSTWGKISKKHGDFGWLDKADKDSRFYRRIDPLWRDRIRNGEGRFSSLRTTKVAAARYDLAQARMRMKRWPSSDPEIIAIYDWEVKKLKAYIKRYGGKK